MKKLLLLFFVSILTMSVSAKGEYNVRYVDDKGVVWDSYKDSLVKVRAWIEPNLGVLHLNIYNETNSRVVVEWENTKLQGMHIAFSDDYIYQLHQPRQDEVIVAYRSTDKAICRRQESIIPLINKKLAKKGVEQEIYLTLPIRKGEKVYDLDITFTVFYSN